MRKLWISSVGFIGVLVLLLMSFSSFDARFLKQNCQLGAANAQDNPCLAQEATLSAMKIELQDVSFQATLDGMNYQATISTLRMQQPGLGSTTSASPSLPFIENFDDNSRGWDLAPHENGSARISQNSLVLSANADEYIVAEVPISDIQNYFLEVNVTHTYPGYGINQFIGFFLGNPTEDDHYLFLVGSGLDGVDRWYVRVYRRSAGAIQLLYETPFEKPLWESGSTFTLGLEANNGLYSLYLNNSQMESAQLTPNDNQFGLVTYSASQAGDATAFFDHLTIRDSR